MAERDAREPSPGDAVAPSAFDIRFQGNRVELLLRAPVDAFPPLDVDTIAAALLRAPLRGVGRDRIEQALAERGQASSDVRVDLGPAAVRPSSDAICAIAVSPDRLAAYAVPVASTSDGGAPPAAAPQPPSAADSTASASGGDAPPADTPQPPAVADSAASASVLAAGTLRRLLEEAGVTTGVMDEVVDAFGDGQPLADIRCVARGDPPVPPIDATLTYHFSTKPELRPIEREDGSVDFHASAVSRFIAAGDVLATRTPGSPGVPGCDVHGAPIAVPAMHDVPMKQIAGKHTSIQEHEIVAAIGGRPVLAAQGVITVLPVFEVDGDLNYGVGNIQFPGDVVVKGDVKPGFTIVAGGSVVIGGLVEGATITAGGDLTVAGTVGERHTVFEVGGNLAARYLHGTEARVGGVVQVVGELVNCVLTADRIATGAQGRIVGGTVSARTEIDTGWLGSRQGAATRAWVMESAPGAVVRARRATYPGVTVQIGTTTRQIAEELPAASFWEVEGAVITLRVNAEGASSAQPAA